LAKITASAVPVFGGTAAEVIETLFRPTIDARRDEWLKSLADAFFRLQGKVEDFSLEQLSQDESFMTTFVTASQAAMRTHQEEKREALRNAVLNAALRTEPDEDMQVVFLGLVDRFTSWHLRILSLLNDPVASANQVNFKPSGTLGSMQTLITGVYPDIKEHKEFYELIYSELMASGLIVSGPISISINAEAMFQRRSTTMGARFLKFISSP
jgi:hypothetical protein